jgi:Serine carboxypeptidase S28
MEATNGLGVLLENRYYGDSNPYNTSTTDQLTYLTTEQTIADNAYFAQHATFPGLTGNLSAPHALWILYGGSLSGAQTAFTVKTYGGDGGIVYGGIASSAPIHMQLDYPEW